jgi:general stress protein CsbA
MKATSPLTPYLFVLMLVVVVGHAGFKEFVGVVMLLIIWAAARRAWRDIHDHVQPSHRTRR